MLDKLSKDESGYEGAYSRQISLLGLGWQGKPPPVYNEFDFCYSCVHFEVHTPDPYMGACGIVQGLIGPHATCDLYERIDINDYQKIEENYRAFSDKRP